MNQQFADPEIDFYSKLCMAVIERNWDRVTFYAHKLRDIKTPTPTDPATCGHNFITDAQLPNPYCSKCGVELVPAGGKVRSALFKPGDPPVRVKLSDRFPEPPPPPSMGGQLMGSAGLASHLTDEELAAEAARRLAKPPAPPPPACPSRLQGHRWLIAETFTDRCSACKLTRPRPKGSPANLTRIGEESDLP